MILDEYVVTVVYSFNGDKRRRSFKAAAGIPHGVNFEIFCSKIKALILKIKKWWTIDVDGIDLKFLRLYLPCIIPVFSLCYFVFELRHFRNVLRLSHKLHYGNTGVSKGGMPALMKNQASFYLNRVCWVHILNLEQFIFCWCYVR